MLHLDEGMIHELLDGELDAGQAAAVRAHLDACVDCRRVYEDASALLAEADRVIASLDEPTRADPPLAGRAAAADAPRGVEGDTRPDGTGVPIVLIPTSEEVPRPAARRTRFAPYAVAAGVLLAVGAYALIPRGDEEPATGGGFVTLPASPADAPIAAQLSDSGGPVPTDRTPAGAAELARAPAAKAAESPNVAAKAAPDSSGRAGQAGEQQLASQGRPEPPASRSVTDETLATDTRQSAAARANALRFPDPPSDALATGAANSAPGRADRGRFTAAPTAAAEAATAAPAPSLESRAQITTRIGLDDAKRELGSPLHAIDGLRPQFVGLVPGRLVPGADPGRNVIRAVYVDAAGRPFYLDQQRLGGTGASRSTASRAGILRGDVQLFLNGQLSADSSAAIQDRIR